MAPKRHASAECGPAKNRKVQKTNQPPVPPVVLLQTASNASAPASTPPLPCSSCSQSQEPASLTFTDAYMPDLDHLQSLVAHVVHNSLSHSYSKANDCRLTLLGKNDNSKVGESNGLMKFGAPMSNLHDIFDDMATKALSLGLETAFPEAPLRIVTMCSGTEAPVLALTLMQKALERKGKEFFKFSHLASAENDRFKQAYIQRNFGPPILFRDVTEFIDEQAILEVDDNIINEGDSKTEKDDSSDDDDNDDNWIDEDDEMTGEEEASEPRAIIRPHTAFGGTAPPPESVHILVAGSSCVDYSALNSDQKVKYKMTGQSFRTLLGIRSYADRYRPNLIVLENVANAPWTGMKKFLRRIGYRGAFIKEDTKNYYLPQTRNRGYMVAFDTKIHSTKAKFKLHLAGKQFKALMKEFKRKATAPFTDFILDEDDPYLQKVKLASTDLLPATSNTDWAKCRHRYAKHRIEHQYGGKRPMTHWQNNGSCRFPDFGWIKWAKVQRERIWDTLDIEYLRHAADRDYDMNYKSRWLELSQNVDRDSDSRAWGVISCLTPTGMPYLTSRGGQVIGREALALQGIPVDDLILTKESSRQLQNLAGNAMSVTIVCAAIFSAIIAAQKGNREGKFFKEVADYSKEDETKSRPAQQIGQLASRNYALKAGQLSLRAVDVPSLEAILETASHTLQFCGCEGFSAKKQGPFQICKKCGHTTCKACGGNPVHNYIPIASCIATERKMPSQFMQEIYQALPTALRLAVSDFEKILPSVESLLKKHTKRAEHEKNLLGLRNAVELALKSTPTRQSIKRGHAWKITYEDRASRLELYITRKCSLPAESDNEFSNPIRVDCYWLLFAKVGSTVCVSSLLREALSHPIARMSPSETLLDGTWQVPQRVFIKLSISSHGDEKTHLESWESKLGIQNKLFKDSKVSAELEVALLDGQIPPELALEVRSEICGKYERLQVCGGASGSMHGRVKSSPGSPMFFFLDPQLLGDVEFDSYVFSASNHRRGHNETRVVAAKVAAGWRLGSRPKIFREAAKSKMTAKSESLDDDRTKKPIVGYINWKKSREIQILPRTFEEGLPMRSCEMLDVSINIGPVCRESAFSVLLVEIPMDDYQKRDWLSGKQHQVPLIGRNSALGEFGWLLKPAASQVPFQGSWWDMKINIEDAKFVACQTCAPNAPKTKYETVVRPTPGKTKKKLEKYEVRLVTLDEEGVRHENALKERPLPLSATMHCPKGEAAILDVKLNIGTLAHRVLAKVSASGCTNLSLVTLRWRVKTDHGLTINPRFSIRPIQDNNFGEVLSPSAELFKRKLWREQSQALKWMVEREQGPTNWEECEREEACIPALAWRIDVEVRSPKEVRGGILADEVGAGKTSTSLALVAYMLKQDRNSEPEQFTPIGASIVLKATLILVPNNLVTQWEKEFDECFGTSGSVQKLVIRSITELLKITSHDLQQADVVLAPWNLLDEPGYWNTLQTFSGAQNRPSTAGRGLQQWLREALIDVDIVLEQGQNKNGFWTAPFPKPAPTGDYTIFERLAKGVLTPEGSDAIKANDPKASSAASLIDWSKSTDLSKTVDDLPPIFHAFTFRRLIVDEFTYLEAKSFLATLELKAQCKWMLSGTPPLSRFDDVNTMAKLLGTRLAADDEEGGCFSFVTNGTKLQREKTDAEEFHGYKEIRSPAWMRARNKVVDSFVEKFIRKNSPKAAKDIQSMEHYKVTSLSPTEEITYFQIFQRLMTQSVKFKPNSAAPKLDNLSHERRLKSVITMSSGPEDALLSCCSKVPSLFNNGEENLDTIQALSNMIAAQEYNFKECVQNLLQQLREAFSQTMLASQTDEQKAPHFLSYRIRVSENQYGDTTAAELLDKLMLAAWRHPKKPASSSNGRMDVDDLESVYESDVEVTLDNRNPKDLKNWRDDMKSRAERLNTTTMGLIEYIRSIRFFSNVRHILREEDLPDCAGCRKSSKDLSASHILGVCGHVACSGCLTKEERLRDDPYSCLDKNCDAPAMPSHAISAARFLETQASESTESGSKMKAVVDEIKLIINGDKEKSMDSRERDHIIVFVQFYRVAAALIKALKAAGIFCTDTVSGKKATDPDDTVARKSAAAGKLIEKFKNGMGGRVCVLQTDSPDAAGWNLHIANHVMFVSTLVARNRYQYLATMTQAIGRAHRYNQKKTVHVYHFLMARTIEVNILQDHTNKTIVKRRTHINGTSQLTGAPASTDFRLVSVVENGDEAGWEGPEIKGAVCSAGDVNAEEQDVDTTEQGLKSDDEEDGEEDEDEDNAYSDNDADAEVDEGQDRDSDNDEGW